MERLILQNYRVELPVFSYSGRRKEKKGRDSILFRIDDELTPTTHWRKKTGGYVAYNVNK